MKSSSLTQAVLLLTLLFGFSGIHTSLALANSDTIEVTAKIEKITSSSTQETIPISTSSMPLNESSIDRSIFTLMVGGSTSILGLDGFGGALEFKPISHLSLLVAHERERDKNDSSFIDFDGYRLIESTHQLYLLRAYRNKNHSGYFISLGQKRAELEVEISPGLFSGVVGRGTKKVNGFVAALGYRFLIEKKSYGQWTIDLGISREPGEVYDETYSAQEIGIFGPTKANVDFKEKDGLNFEARAGVSF